MPRATTRWIVLGTALVLVAASLIEGIGNAGDGAGAGGELVWATGGVGARPGGPTYEVVRAWNQLHPNGPTVRIDVLPNIPDDQRQQMALELDAHSSELDVLDLDLVWTAEFADKGWLEDMEDVPAQVRQEWLPGPLRSAMWRGKLWAAPQTTDAPFLYYRRDLVTTPPATWEELMEVGRRVGGEHGIVPYVGQGDQYEGLVVCFLEYLWSAGSDLFSPDGTQVRFEDTAALKALEFMREAQRNGFYAPDLPTMRAEDVRHTFQSGGAVFMRNWPYAYQLMENPDPQDPSKVSGLFGIAPLPKFAGSAANGSWGLGGHNLAVSRYSRNKRAAKEFALFVSTTPAIQRLLAVRHSGAPTMRSAYRDLKDLRRMELLDKILPEAQPRPATPDWSEISVKIAAEVHASYAGAKDPGDAVREIRAFLESKVPLDRHPAP